jgi:hypothetical protein
MASILPSSRYRIEDDIRRLRKLASWQSARFNGKLWRATVPLTGMRPCDFVYFFVYTLSGLMLPFSTFFFTLLEHYGLQL